MLLITLSSLIKGKQRSHANHRMRGLHVHYPRLILEWLGFPLALAQMLQVLVYLTKYLVFPQISSLASKKATKKFTSVAQTHKKYSRNRK